VTSTVFGEQAVEAGAPTPGKLLVISQVYVPDPAAVGQHLADVAEEMAKRDWRVTVLASSRGYDDPTQRYTRREVRNGVEIRRFSLSSFGKRSIAVRLVAQALFLTQSFIWGLFSQRPDMFLVSTSPPFAGFIGAMLSRLRNVPLVWWVMDINPDQMIATGKLRNTSIVAKLYDWMNRVTLRRAAKVITLDEFMAQRLHAKFPIGDKLVVIPPWSHTDPAQADLPRENAFRRRHGLEGKFVVMYAGNHALQHPLDTLLDAARAFEYDPGMVFVFIGGGCGKAQVEHRIAAGSKNLQSLPYQPLEELAETLAAADVHVVSMGSEMVGIVHPCKIYGAILTGRPILFFGPRESHIGQLVVQNSLGWQVAHGELRDALNALADAVSLSATHRHASARGKAAFTVNQLPSALLCAQLCDQLATTAANTALPKQRKTPLR
jgi:colanic acid biosynthesis glycosyl transferase WcaI